jgi:hypothetical protein
LARRTRRDLSNPKIRRIVRHQFQSSLGQISLNPNSFGGFLRRLVVPILVILTLFLGYSLLLKSDFHFGSLFDSFNVTQAQGEPKKENENIAAKEEKTDIDPQQTEQDNKALMSPVKQKLQVEVLNACGASGIASTVTQYLRDHEVDVVNVGNYTRFDINKTLLWERVKDADSQRIAQLLGVSENNIDSKIDSNLQLDITIILGSDYATLKPFSN